MRPNHDHVAIGDAGIVQMVSKNVRRLINLFVGKPPLGTLRRRRFDYAYSVGMLLRIFVENRVNRAHVPGPIQVHCGIWQLDHG